MVNIATFILLIFITNSVSSNLDELRELNSPFRVNKHNLLWDRAKKSIGLSPKLETLRRELKKLDKLSISLKHLEDKDSDEARNMAIETKQMYLDILNRYGLKTNQVGVDDDEAGHNHVKAKFGDKIEKLWQDAMYSGKFTSEEMDKLEQEFKHHEKKVEAYRHLANKIVEHDTISENDLRSLDKLPESELKELRKDLKDKHHKLTSDFTDLQRKVKHRMSDFAGDFSDSRVIELWEQAKKKGFSKQELESIKEELKHFQIRVDKHNHWKDRQVTLGHDLNDGRMGEPDEHERVSDKVREHARLVKKYHATMLDRIHKRDEL